jgi:hypothetical protein
MLEAERRMCWCLLQLLNKQVNAVEQKSGVLLRATVIMFVAENV